MVTKREKIDHEGLIISIEPIDEKPFYLTGETPSFKVVIENPSSKERKGKLFFRWRLSNVSTIREVKFDLPEKKGEYEIPREWLYREGTAIYELLIIDTKQGPTQPFGCYSSVHPLCSYYVRDKDLYEYEESYRNMMKHYSRVTIVLTIIIIFLTIVNLILLCGPQIIGLIKN